MERAEFITNDHLSYLDDLRESGITNMFGAAPYIQEEFDMDEKDARETLSFWMHNFK